MRMMISPNLNNNILSAMEDCVEHDRLSSMHFLTTWAIMTHWGQVVKGNVVLVLLLNFQNVEPHLWGQQWKGSCKAADKDLPAPLLPPPSNICVNFCRWQCCLVYLSSILGLGYIVGIYSIKCFYCVERVAIKSIITMAITNIIKKVNLKMVYWPWWRTNKMQNAITMKKIIMK